jgi:hypothetical protein
MINFILKKAKWVKFPKADSSYINRFAIAQLNFERNLMEERRQQGLKFATQENKKSGF